MKRIVILGNSGSGKTFLAREWSAAGGIPLIHLDEIFWLPGCFNERRTDDEVQEIICSKIREDEWIAEGVFGSLAEKFLCRATHLVWLDLPWGVCRASLLARGSESSRQTDPDQAEKNFRILLEWAEAYQVRSGDCSHAGHLRIFETFAGKKTRITTRADACATRILFPD
ncbi:MAG: hypothetical protein EOP85_02570 [Verrucomicrobiaceae bacterium]|nr:MAG: hypothetical protein EOP85_02570 [Verrucomicrobiaceae bacterium]